MTQEITVMTTNPTNPTNITNTTNTVNTTNTDNIDNTAICIDILLAIILPPLGVFFKFGCGCEFWICVLLTILGHIPGVIYAVYVLTKK